MKLPPRVKRRLYVVHTSNIPEEYGLRVAPTGTAGTLRLDQVQRGAHVGTKDDRLVRKTRKTRDAYSISLENSDVLQSAWSSASNEYAVISEDGLAIEDISSHGSSPTVRAGFQGGKAATQRTSLIATGESSFPLVSLRPSSSTDAWFILNLLSAVPFMSR
jgi:hypothetical protein